MTERYDFFFLKKRADWGSRAPMSFRQWSEYFIFRRQKELAVPRNSWGLSFFPRLDQTYIVYRKGAIHWSVRYWRRSLSRPRPYNTVYVYAYNVYVRYISSTEYLEETREGLRWARAWNATVTRKTYVLFFSSFSKSFYQHDHLMEMEDAICLPLLQMILVTRYPNGLIRFIVL
jgi:hypothetical protein